jgi:hypothetical protein
MVNKMISFKTDTKNNLKNENPTVTALERSVTKQFAAGGLNQVLGCTNLTLAPTGSHTNKQVKLSLVKKLNPTNQLDKVACKSTQTYNT